MTRRSHRLANIRAYPVADHFAAAYGDEGANEPVRRSISSSDPARTTFTDGTTRSDAVIRLTAETRFAANAGRTRSISRLPVTALAKWKISVGRTECRSNSTSLTEVEIDRVPVDGATNCPGMPTHCMNVYSEGDQAVDKMATEKPRTPGDQDPLSRPFVQRIIVDLLHVGKNSARDLPNLGKICCISREASAVMCSEHNSNYPL